MGYYINPGVVWGKAEAICQQYGGQEIADPPEFLSEVPEGKALICVVSNGFFDVAAFCYNERELQEFTWSQDTRPKTWLHIDWSKAVELTGLPE